jgi:hypothetical protein
VEHTRVLQVGLDPAVIDFSPWPGETAQLLWDRIRASGDELRGAGFEVDLCLVGLDPPSAGAAVRRALSTAYQVVEIGAGLRMSREHTEVLEWVVDAVVGAGDGVRVCFNTSPETTLEAVRRAVAR